MENIERQLVRINNSINNIYSSINVLTNSLLIQQTNSLIDSLRHSRSQNRPSLQDQQRFIYNQHLLHLLKELQQQIWLIFWEVYSSPTSITVQPRNSRASASATSPIPQCQVQVTAPGPGPSSSSRSTTSSSCHRQL